MIQFEFTPGYYEWHLTDKATGEILHYMIDPSEDLYNEDGEPMTLEEMKDFFADDLHCADWHYMDNDEYNGILPSERLTEQEIITASSLIAETLYNYYIAA